MSTRAFLSLLRAVLIKTLPTPVYYRLLATYARIISRRAAQAFAHAPKAPEWLDITALESLQEKYPVPAAYRQDPRAKVQRGTERARQILRAARTYGKNMSRFLELGCHDGMVSCALRSRGKIATAIDTRSKSFDERALREGVEFVQMDAERLAFQDDSFDFVFSYNAFEHFPDPEAVLKEAIRIVRPGGCIYLVFGPLFMSPKGAHAYNVITVPYFRLLFQDEAIGDFISHRGLPRINTTVVNGWTLEDYRDLWDRYSHRLKKKRYLETYNPLHADLITRYPSCFKSKTDFFDNLLVSDLEILFEKVR